eukprot:jgi/Hompol1/6889/HPOL_002506-RA
MAQYSYDETGVLFNFFVLTLLALVLLPATYYVLFGSSKGSLIVDDTDNRFEHCAAKRSYLRKTKNAGNSLIWKLLRVVLLILGWALFAFIAYKAFVTKIDDGVWDPYQILGIDSGADESVIRAEYKRLARIYHPDKVRDPSKKAEAQQIFTEISKAHTVLTDPEARKIFDETGHPDGKQAFQLGLALPKWLVEEGNTSLVLLFYGLVFGVALPTVVARWWSKAKHITRNKIMNETMGLFYREIKDSSGFKELLDVLCKAREFQSIITLGHAAAYDELTEKIKDAMEAHTLDHFDKTKKLPRLASAFGPFPSHRTQRQQQRQVVEQASILTTGMLQIVAARNWLATSSSVIDLSQAIYARQSPLFQLPFIDTNLLRNAPKIKKPAATVEQFLALEASEQKEMLSALDANKISIIREVAGCIPTIKIVKHEYSVLGEPAINPGSIITLSIKLRAIYNGKERTDGNDELDDPEEEAKTKQWWMDKTESIREPHAPHFFASKKPTWWVILGNVRDRRLICINKVSDLSEDKTVRMQFQAPPEPGSWTFQILIKSDSFVGADKIVDAKLVVIPEVPVEEDDNEDAMSEPEPDSFAAQLQAIKQQQLQQTKRRKVPKHLRQDYDDSSDSDDEDDEEDEEEENDEDDDQVVHDDEDDE